MILDRVARRQEISNKEKEKHYEFSRGSHKYENMARPSKRQRTKAIATSQTKYLRKEVEQKKARAKMTNLNMA